AAGGGAGRRLPGAARRPRLRLQRGPGVRHPLPGHRHPHGPKRALTMTTSFPLRWRALCLGKRGNAAEDYEDAAAGDAPGGRFAVADGASEASFAALWARLLVEGFLAATGRPWRDLGWVGPLRGRWAAEVDGRPLPWYAEEKRELGAFATFLG